MPRSPKTAARQPPPPARPAAEPSALEYARGVLEAEARAILGLRERLGEPFLRALELLRTCAGQVVVTGMGKAGLIGQKLSAVLASTGVRSVYLHPAEAFHGDLGRVAPGDVVLALSNSGTTEELVQLLPSFRRLGTPVVALTGDGQSPLARGADLVLDIGRIEEACPLGLVPTASTAALHALGDALAMALLRERSFGTEDYARLHPGGKLGRAVLRVHELMRTGTRNPLVRDTDRLSQAVVTMTNTPGKPGATSVVDAHGRLVGIFTDGDLRRLVEQGWRDFDAPVRAVMGHQPRCVQPQLLVLEAARLMSEAQVDQLPVVDDAGRCVGLLDVQDLLAARLI